PCTSMRNSLESCVHIVGCPAAHAMAAIWLRGQATSSIPTPVGGKENLASNQSMTLCSKGQAKSTS
ncbi:MAG: hypothetical protein VXV85_07860, partial [Candidatus Thermoplasmatota archaeon]|nr:hypothetical protein [Candidatus Thermoplasmatota archaeon]